MDSLNEITKKLRTILLDMITEQLETDTGIDNRTNLYIVEVQFIKHVIASITGTNIDDNDKLHDWACDLVDEVHNKFGA